MFWRRFRVRQISTKKLIQWLTSGKSPIILDIRPEEQCKQTGIIYGSILVTPSQLDYEMEHELDLFQGKPVVVVCRSGINSKKVVKKLVKMGIEAYNLKQGIMGWFQNKGRLVSL